MENKNRSGSTNFLKSYLLWASSDALFKGFMVTFAQWAVIIIIFRLLDLISQEALNLGLLIAFAVGFFGGIVHQILVWIKVRSVHNNSSTMYDVFLVQVLPTGEVNFGKAFWRSDGVQHTVYVPIPDEDERTFVQVCTVTVGQDASSVSQEFLLTVKVDSAAKTDHMAGWLNKRELYEEMLLVNAQPTSKRQVIFVDAWIGRQFEKMLAASDRYVQLMFGADQIRVTDFNMQLHEILQGLRFSDSLGLTGVSVTVTSDTEKPLMYSTRARV